MGLWSDGVTLLSSLVTEAHSGKIMWYQLSDNMNSTYVVKVLKTAVNNSVGNTKLIDQTELRKHNIRPSMTTGYDCYQNALAERISGILKSEFLIYQCNNKKELELLVKE